MKYLTFKVQLTPTQSERFQKEVFAKGGKWAEGEKTVLLTENPFMFLERGEMSTTDEHHERRFRCAVATEVLTEHAFSLLENATRLRTDDNDDNERTDEPANTEEFHSGLTITAFLKRLDGMQAKNQTRQR